MNDKDLTIDNNCFFSGLIVGAASSRTPKTYAIYKGGVYDGDDIGITKVYVPVNKPNLPKGFVSPTASFNDILESLSDDCVDLFWLGFFKAKKRLTFIPGLFSDVAVVSYLTYPQLNNVISWLLDNGIPEFTVMPNRSKLYQDYPLILVIDNDALVEKLALITDNYSSLLHFRAQLFV